MIYNSNQDDIDHRHVWTVPVDGSAKPTRLAAKSNGSEWQPVDDQRRTHGDAARRRDHAAARDGDVADGNAHSLLENMLPAGFDPSDAGDAAAR